MDGVGLLTPEALDHHPMRVPEQRSAGFIGAIPAAMVEKLRPEIVVGLDIFVEELRNAEIAKQYHLDREPVYGAEELARMPSKPLWWSRNLNIFIRRDLQGGERPVAGAREAGH